MHSHPGKKKKFNPRPRPIASPNPARPARLQHDPPHYLAHFQIPWISGISTLSMVYYSTTLPTVSTFLLKLACGISTVLHKFCTFGSYEALIFGALPTVSIDWIHTNFSTCHSSAAKTLQTPAHLAARAAPLRQCGYSGRQQPPPRQQ